MSCLISLWVQSDYTLQRCIPEIHRFFFLTCIWQIKRCRELDWLWMKSSRNSQWCKTVFRWLIRRLHLRRISIRNRNTSRRVVSGHEKVPNRWKMPKPQQLQKNIKNREYSESLIFVDQLNHADHFELFNYFDNIGHPVNFDQFDPFDHFDHFDHNLIILVILTILITLTILTIFWLFWP